MLIQNNKHKIYFFTVSELSISKMAPATKVNIMKAKRKDMDTINLAMGLITKETLKIIALMDKESISLVTEEGIMGDGNKIKCMDMEFLNLAMGIDMKESTIMMSKKDWAVW